ncbi:MAG: bifunctional ornithine acetyltransferase/N-acetylglutamate synthase [Enterocloster bolteae]
MRPDGRGAAAEPLEMPDESVLVASTGVIGMQLPMDRITAGIKAMAPLLCDGSPESGTGGIEGHYDHGYR